MKLFGNEAPSTSEVAIMRTCMYVCIVQIDDSENGPGSGLVPGEQPPNCNPVLHCHCRVSSWICNKLTTLLTDCYYCISMCRCFFWVEVGQPLTGYRSLTGAFPYLKFKESKISTRVNKLTSVIMILGY